MPLNPITTITGNGIPGSVSAAYTTGTTSWIISTQDIPGQVTVGTFPNALNANTITTQNLTYNWPYRGGKNLSSLPVSINSSTYIYTPLGISSVGIVFMSPYSGLTAGGSNGTVWNINSVVAEIVGEDIYSGDPTSTGLYRYKNSKFINNNAWGSVTGSTWSSSGYRQTDGHSKILGWARDGYPIYGPYGYSIANSSTSSVVRLVSGYAVDDGVTDRPTSRNVIAGSAVNSGTVVNVFSSSGIGAGMSVSSPEITGNVKIVRVVGRNLYLNTPVTLTAGTSITASYPTGVFLEDWYYNEEGVTSLTLDRFNGRVCVTPDFPTGTYAYFLTENSSGIPQFPYIIGPTFYGKLFADSNDSTLETLLTNAISAVFTPAFTSTVTNYYVTVENQQSSIYFVPKTRNSFATILFNNTSTVVSNQASPLIQLPVGLTTSTFTVTSQYQTTSTYTVTVERVKSPVNQLFSLTTNRGIISPAYAPLYNGPYRLTVNSNVTDITITAARFHPNSTVVLNGTNITNSPSITLNLDIGINPVSIVVTAQNGDVRTYTLDITRLSDISLLSGIEVSTGTLTPSFNNSTFYYYSNVTYFDTTATIKATAIDSSSQIFVNEELTPSGQYATPLNLNLGVNAQIIKVVSSDQSNFHRYRVLFVRPNSPINTLDSITVSTGSLTPAFASTVTDYTVNIGHYETAIEVTAEVTDADAYLSINYQSFLSGTPYLYSDLVVGSNIVRIQVVAPNGIEKIYTVNVIRAGSPISTLSEFVVGNAIISPVFDSNTFNYSSTVSYTIDNVTIRPKVTESNASISINNVSILSGATSPPIALGVASTTTILTKVIAQDGINSSTYTLSIFRKANYDSTLAALTISPLGTIGLLPSFSPDILSYNAAYLFTDTDITITAYTNAIGGTISISRKILSSITGPYNVNSGVPVTFSLVLGLQTFEITSIAPDPSYTTKYTIDVYKADNSISTLDNLRVSVGELNPIFDKNVYFYNLALPHRTTSVTVTPTFTDPIGSTATIATQYFVSNNQESNPINLHIGPNSIPVVCFAADYRSFYTGYTIIAERAAQELSDDPNLVALETNAGLLQPAFNTNISDYTLTVPYTVPSIKIKPTKSQYASSVRINELPVNSAEYSPAINLTVGQNLITVKVTAQDRATTKTFNLNITRIGSTVSTLDNLFVSPGYLEPAFDKNIVDYIVSLPYTTLTASVKPVLTDSNAQQAINGIGLVKGFWCPAIPLNVGDNKIRVDVLAGDNLTPSVYTVNFKRASGRIFDPVTLFLSTTTLTVSVVDQGDGNV